MDPPFTTLRKDELVMSTNIGKLNKSVLPATSVRTISNCWQLLKDEAGKSPGKALDIFEKDNDFTFEYIEEFSGSETAKTLNWKPVKNKAKNSNFTCIKVTIWVNQNKHIKNILKIKDLCILFDEIHRLSVS